MEHSPVDIVVVGAGNAALCAALSAREHGATVTVLEVAPESLQGGNTAFTAGAMRVAYNGVEDLRRLMPDLTDEQADNTDFGSYPEEKFFEDIARVTESRGNPDLIELLVTRSYETLEWMTSKGVRFMPIYGRQAFNVNGKFTFWGGLTIESWGGGPGLVDSLVAAVKREGINLLYETRAVGLVRGEGGIEGVRIRRKGVESVIPTKAVILGSGGFEANNEWRTRYLGQGWDLAKVRGSMYNQGDGIRMALEIGASPAGNWSGCHAVQWDLNAPEYGDLAVGDGFQKHSYPWGLVVNAEGERFVDEGADFRNYTYAKYGRIVLEQPGHFAYQIFDAKVAHLLRDEYRIREVSKIKADTLEELAAKLGQEGVNEKQFLATIQEYNSAVQTSVAFNPNVKDGRGTVGLALNKTNWANTIDEAPFEAYAVTCGLTFTFGGLRISTSAEVLEVDKQSIPGLFACGELVGDIFYFNYPGGSGLTSGAVFGKIAGNSAGAYVSSIQAASH